MGEKVGCIMGIASLPLKDFDPHQLNSKNYALVKNYLENNCTFSFMQCRTKYLDFFNVWTCVQFFRAIFGQKVGTQCFMSKLES